MLPLLHAYAAHATASLASQASPHKSHPTKSSLPRRGPQSIHRPGAISLALALGAALSSSIGLYLSRHHQVTYWTSLSLPGRSLRPLSHGTDPGIRFRPPQKPCCTGCVQRPPTYRRPKAWTWVRGPKPLEAMLMLTTWSLATELSPALAVMWPLARRSTCMC